PLPDVFDGGAHNAVGRGELVERSPHASIGEVAEGGPQRVDALERPRVARRWRVERRPDVELAAAHGDEPDAPSAPEELGEVLEPVAVGHDESMGAVPQVARLARPEGTRPNPGPNA